MSEVTQMLLAIDAGDETAADRLMALVYEELRQLAAQKLSRENPGQTLDATALVHEAWLRLDPRPGSANFAGRRHFFGAAAQAMERILVERARQRQSLKRGGDRERLDLDQIAVAATQTPAEFLALHEALAKLETIDRRKADLVRLRFFAGLTNAQAAAVLGISLSTADNDWAYARCWIRLELEKS